MGIGKKGDILLGITTSGNSKNINLAFKAAKEMMEEMKNKDEFTKKLYKNWSIFRKKIVQLSPMTELGYMSLREKFKEIT